MTVNEQLMGLGSWGITLREETPREVLDRLGYFGHVAIVPGRVNPAEYNDTLLTMARYVGVLTKRDFDDDKRISGQGMALWLGDSDDKGEVFESPVSIVGQTFATTITTLMSGSTAVVVGTLYSVAGNYSGTHVWQSRGKAIDYVCQTMGAEWRVNGNAALDAGPIANLYVTSPTCVVVRKDAGKDLTLTGITGDMQLSRDVEDFTTRVVLLAEGEGESTATGSANIASNPYLDIRGNPVKRVRLVSESSTSTGNAQVRAQLQLNRFTGTRNALGLSADVYEVRGSFQCGDYVWVYDPDSGLYDTTQEITFRGQRINPTKLRVVGASWPVTDQMTVAYRHQDGTWIDLTDYVNSETGSTKLTVGELNRSLTNAGTEPVGPRPIPDTTIPGVVSWDLPFTTGVYLDGLGNTRARILASWLLPLNADGSTILDGSHYEIRYGISPATDWQTEFAPWGSFQANILDLSPGVDYDFQIRAVDLSANQGAWSATETATANPDTIAPSTPAPPTVAGSRLAIQVTHTLGKASGGTYNLELDLDHLEVHVGSVGSFTPDSTTLKGEVLANSGMIRALIPAVGTVDVEETTTRHVKVIAVDEAGNKSSPSTAATATALLIDNAHISDLTVTKVTAGTVSANWLLGASIRTASSGQRVELNATGLHGFNGAGTELVTLSNTGSFTLRSASSGARINLDGTGFRVFNSSAVETVSLLATGSFVIKSASSGARIELDTTGFAAFNSSGTQTVDIDAATGDVTITGIFRSGLTGKRIEVITTSGDPFIKFYGSSSGTDFAYMAYAQSIVNANHPAVVMGSSTGLSNPGAVIVDSGKVHAIINPGVSGSEAGLIALTGYAELRTPTSTIQVGDPNIFLNAPNGNVRVVSSTGFEVNGVTKNFIIDHPAEGDRYLIHGCTESPHNGVEYWGTATLDDLGVAEVELPRYFEALTAYEGRAVLLTGIGEHLLLASATYPKDGRFCVHGVAGQRVAWLVKAIRKDVPPVLVEPRRDEVIVRGDGPYRYYTIKEAAHD
ncbi:fibronectin type III domain-containing protein [Nonomuraea basaltis]|uniref:fibronectin type III domain-containing protein n=1 Tax=Nonomuraea basaltis TaxID=2495887 RepID=UPI00110C4594|nr:fibronectin type III domain-containing protein [Nonomuraea basaltis]TMS00196.1 fibronectin type III domain-containing protein [Nonomuraea basaltis]